MARIFWAEDDGLPAGDRGAAYGDGLFETILMRGQQGALVARHLERMVRDATRLGIPVTRRQLQDAYAQAVNRYGDASSAAPWVLKLVLTRGAGGRGYRPDPGMEPNLQIQAAPAPPPPDPDGVDVEFSRVPLTVNPLLAGIKSLNRLEQVMAAREIQDGLFEVIQSNARGELVEGSRTNLLLATDAGWFSPPRADLAVVGVMRQWVLERLRARGEQVTESPILPEHVLGDGCLGFYLLNSVLGVVSVGRLAGQDLPVDGGLATICDPLQTLE